MHTRGKPLDSSVDLHEVARRTSGLTGADLANLANEAAIFAGRSARERITSVDFDDALDRVVAGLQQRKLITDKEKRVIAYHEAGHALVARLMGDAMQLHKVTIVPRGLALGYTLNLPEEDRYLQSTEELRDWLKVILAGRAAEQVVFGRITNGAANDLDRATADRARDGVRVGHGRRAPAPPGACRQLRAVGGDEAPARRRAARDHRRGLPRRARLVERYRAVPRRAGAGACSRTRRSSGPRSTGCSTGSSPSRTRRSTSASSSRLPEANGARQPGCSVATRPAAGGWRWRRAASAAGGGGGVPQPARRPPLPSPRRSRSPRRPSRLRSPAPWPRSATGGRRSSPLPMPARPSARASAPSRCRP